jgi:SPRY domain
MNLPPAPVGTPFGSFTWADWYEKVRRILNEGLLNHNDLQNIQGGNATERYHLTQAEYTGMTSATYIPTAQIVSNLGSVTPNTAFYQRVGDIIHVWGSSGINVTTISLDTEFNLTLPIASNLGSLARVTLCGTSVSTGAIQSSAVINDGTSNKATFKFSATGTGATVMTYSYAYKYVAIPVYTYATWNPVDKSGGVTLSGANLTAAIITGPPNGGNVRSTLGKSSGKWYCEVTAATGYCDVGIGNSTMSLGPSSYVGADANGYGYYTNGNKYNNGIPVGYGSTYTTGDVIGIALDMDSGTLTFYKNGVSQGVAYSGLSGTYYVAIGNYTADADLGTANFGATAFAFPAPPGFNSGWYI